jgi:tetratricopeptide (TPR) repeat protein
MGIALVAHIVEQQLNVEVTAASLLAWLLAGTLVGAARPLIPAAAPAEQAGSRRQRALALCAGLVIAALVSWWVLRPLRADWSYALGLAAERSGDGPVAEAILVTAVGGWPYEPTYWNELARVRMAIARASLPPTSLQAYVRAVDAADHAVAFNPASAQLLSNWGLIAAEAAARTADPSLGNRALAAAKEATRRAPGYWIFRRSAGATAFNLGDYAVAVAELERATELFDGDAASWSALGDAASQTRDLPTARRAYQRTLDLVPTDAHARDALARLPDGQ